MRALANQVKIASYISPTCPEERAMWTLLAIAAVALIAVGLIAVGLTVWRDWRPLTDKERAR
jgi:hypothetical protein